MKHTLINILAAVAVIGGVAAAAVAPWWVVWLICLPVVYAGAVVLIKNNTNYIEEV